MAPPLHFETVFWSQKQPEKPSPDFSTGFQALHRKLSQSEVENDEIISFFKERIAIEKTYASRLSDQPKVASRSTGFGGDDGASLKTCFDQIRATSAEFGERHLEASTQLTEVCLTPLVALQTDYRRALASKKTMETTLREFDGLVRDAEKARVLYGQRCRAADNAEERALKETDSNSNRASLDETAQMPMLASISTASPPSEIVQLGQQSMAATELDTLVRAMRREIPIKEYRYLFKKYQHTSSGEEIAVWLQKNLAQCKDSPMMADRVGQQLISPLGILQPISQTTFEASATAVYQWRVNPDDDASNVPSTPSASSTLGGLFQRIGTIRTPTSQYPGEERHKKARSDAEQADQAYRSAVKRVDQMRTHIEESLCEHFTSMERIELERIETIKQVFEAFAKYLNNTLMPGDKAIAEKITTFQASLKPNEDVQYIAHQYFVSSFSPAVILYENHYHGIALDQVFGVPLKELGKQSKTNAPHFVTCLLEAIEQGAKALQEEEQEKIWTTSLKLTSVHALREKVNLPSDRVSVELLQQYEPALLAALFRLYCLELPDCLLTFDFYDEAQTLYRNSEQDSSLRLPTLSNLIAAVLPGAHFATLTAILEHLKRVLQLSETKIKEISDLLGPLMIRPRHESLATLRSRMPSLVFQDLLLHHGAIFTEATLQSHAQHEKRRQAQPLVADIPAPETPKIRNPFKSLIRSASTREKDTTDLPTPTPAFSTPISQSFITQSPPASPKFSPVNEVMFNLEDHIEQEDNKNDSKSDTKDSTEGDNVETNKTDPPAKTEDTPNDDLDPFFADD